MCESTCIFMFLKNFFRPLAVAGIGSVHPSLLLYFCLSRHFLGIVSLVFSRFFHGARNPYEIVHGRAEFRGKCFFVPKLGNVIEKFEH